MNEQRRRVGFMLRSDIPATATKIGDSAASGNVLYIPCIIGNNTTGFDSIRFDFSYTDNWFDSYAVIVNDKFEMLLGDNSNCGKLTEFAVQSAVKAGPNISFWRSGDFVDLEYAQLLPSLTTAYSDGTKEDTLSTYGWNENSKTQVDTNNYHFLGYIKIKICRWQSSVFQEYISFSKRNTSFYLNLDWYIDTEQ